MYNRQHVLQTGGVEFETHGREALIKVIMSCIVGNIGFSSGV